MSLPKMQQLSHRNDAPIFIVAMPRSGTTLLEQILAAHSQTHTIGESYIIDNARKSAIFHRKTPPNHNTHESEIELIAETANNMLPFYDAHGEVKRAAGKVIVDKTLSTYLHIGFASSMLPNAKFIYMKRQPLDIILSVYQLYVGLGPNTPWTLEELAKHYKIFEQYMAHWQKTLPDNMLTVQYESLTEDPETFTKNLLNFCKLPWEEQCLDYHDSKNTVNTPSSHQVRQPINKNAVARWHKYARQLQPAPRRA